MSNEKKWTPGPWIAHHRKGDFGEYSAVEIENQRPCSICVCSIRERQEAANAELIAAAPDLYEALEALLTEMGTVRYCDDPPLDAFDSHVSACRKALAKARGEV